MIEKLFFSILLAIFLISVSLVSATVEIVIEYNLTTTTTLITTTTTSGGNGGGGGGGGGGPPPGQTTTTIATQNPVITYAIPGNLVLFLNETITMEILISNPSGFTIHNLELQASGLPPNSYNITAPVKEFLPSTSTKILVFFNNSAIGPGTYTITWLIKSDEINKSATTVLEAKGLTAEEFKQQETAKTMAQAKPTIEFFKFVLFAIILIASVSIILMLFFHFRKRCTSCGGKLTKDFVLGELIGFTCKKCGAKFDREKKRIEKS